MIDRSMPRCRAGRVSYASVAMVGGNGKSSDKDTTASTWWIKTATRFLRPQRAWINR